GNPVALRKFFDTGGQSAVRGLTNMLNDIATNHGMPSQVDKSAFKVGGNLACTPGQVVFKNDVLELIQYAPATPTVYRRPLLAIPPQINKFYVLDLAPGRSLLEFLVRSGMQTFALSWRNPTPAQRDWGLGAFDGATPRGNGVGPNLPRQRGPERYGRVLGRTQHRPDASSAARGTQQPGPCGHVHGHCTGRGARIAARTV